MPVTVDLSIALSVIAAAHAEAVRRSVVVSAAVVDAGGNLVAFGRMDGAEIAGPVLAVDKAYTAVANRMATSALAALAAPGGELFGIQANGGGRFVIFGGGVPIVVHGTVVGGVGVSGASTADDEACALVGLKEATPGQRPESVDVTRLGPPTPGHHERMTTTKNDDDRREDHLTAEEDDGSAELQPEDGGTAPPPPDEAGSAAE